MSKKSLDFFVIKKWSEATKRKEGNLMDEELLWWYVNGGDNGNDEDQEGCDYMKYLYEVDGNVVEIMLDESDFYNDGYDEQFVE